METIQTVISQFLDEQKVRLKERTFRVYDDVLDSYRLYLNAYGPNYIDGELEEEWEKANETDVDAFVKIVPASEIASVGYGEFLDYFIKRKLMYYTESYRNNCVRVLRKFTKWLRDQQIVDEDQYEDLMFDFEN